MRTSNRRLALAAVCFLFAVQTATAQKPEQEKQPFWGDRSIQWSPKPAAVSFEQSPSLAQKLAAGELGFGRIAVVQRQPIGATHIYTYHHEGGAPGGGLFILTLGQGGGLKKLVDAGESQIHHLDVSFGGKEILFNWRKGPKEKYQVWRIGVDGAGLKQLTDGPHHNYDACWLPDGDIAFLSTRRCGMAYCWSSIGGVLHRMDRDGGNVRRISHNLLHDFTPAVMEDGRLIYMRWEYVDRGAIPTQSLWTINPDGTMLQAFFGNRVDRREDKRLRLPGMPDGYFHARQIPGTPRVLCILTGHYKQFGGVGILDPVFGDNARESLRVITPTKGETVGSKGRASTEGAYESPQPLDDRYFLVSNLGTLLVRSYDGDEAAVLLKPQEWLGFYDAQPVRPRRVPVRASPLPAGDCEPWATIVLQDVYQGLGPYVKRGEVKQICVVEEGTKPANQRLAKRGGWDFQSPAISCGATYAPKKVWGFAPVEADGSACFKAPAGVPLYFMALDAQGRAVQRMRSFTHFMPGAVEGCVGCHEPRSRAPALQPALPQALRPAPSPLQEPAWGVKGFSYPELIQPILDKHCIACHRADNPPKGVRLTGEPCPMPGGNLERFNASYIALTRRRPLLGSDGQPTAESRNWVYRDYHDPKEGAGAVTANLVRWTCTDNGSEANIPEITPRYWGSPASPLTDLILSGHRDKDGKPRVEMDEASRRTLMLWMDLNVPYYGSLTENK
jgi:hypothetical protein